MPYLLRALALVLQCMDVGDLSIAAKLALDDFCGAEAEFQAALSIYESINWHNPRKNKSILSHIGSVLWQSKVYSGLLMG